MDGRSIRIITTPNPGDFTRVSAGCIVLSYDLRIILQERDNHCPRFPGRISTFGGGVEGTETPLQALQRELKEELGASVFPHEPIALGILTEPDTHYRELIYAFFWHDKHNTITGCYEGKCQYFSSVESALIHPHLMSDVSWLLKECQHRQLF